jgi:hypothetical protein
MFGSPGSCPGFLSQAPWPLQDGVVLMGGLVRLRLRLHHYICLKGHLSGSLEKACNLTYVNKGEATMIRKRKGRKKV